MPTSSTTPQPSWPRMQGNRPSGSSPDRVKTSVWQRLVVTIRTSTSPSLGPSRSTSSISKGRFGSQAIAARVFMRVLLVLHVNAIAAATGAARSCGCLAVVARSAAAVDFDDMPQGFEARPARDFRQLGQKVGSDALFHRAAIIADREDRRMIVVAVLAGDEGTQRFKAMDLTALDQRREGAIDRRRGDRRLRAAQFVEQRIGDRAPRCRRRTDRTAACVFLPRFFMTPRPEPPNRSRGTTVILCYNITQ